MKKAYINPDLVLLVFHTDDVITASPINIVDNGDGDFDHLDFPI